MARQVQTRAGFLSSTETALRLGCTQPHLRNLREKGMLEGEYSREKRRWWYALEDVAEAVKLYRTARPRTDGETAAEAFKAYRAGRTLQDVVIDLRISVDKARTLKEQYDPGPLFFTEKQHATVRSLLTSHGFRGGHPEEICEAIKELCVRATRLLKLSLDDDKMGKPEPPAPRQRRTKTSARANGATPRKKRSARSR